jgi:hypothetical protein
MKKVFLLGIALCITSMAFAFSGKGSGTEKDPYLVSNADELFEVRNELSAYYKQVDDIDLTAFIQEDNPKLGWSPIGTTALPFAGTYDGGNKTITGLYINRETNDNIGLFGVVLDATIKNLSVVHPNIVGKDYVGVIVGNWYYYTGNGVYEKGGLTNIVVIGGTLSGNNYCASLIGSINPINSHYTTDVTTYTTSVVKCYSSTTVMGKQNASGICDFVVNGQLGNRATYDVLIQDVRFDGRVEAVVSSGILNNSERITCSSASTNGAIVTISRCIMSGSLFSLGTFVTGIAGTQYNYKEDISYNYTLADTLASKETIYRTSRDAHASNYALATSTLLINQKVTEVNDDEYQGTSYGKKVLMKQSTYEGSGFDFTSTWKIQEGASYPYLISQSDPATISEFTSGSKGYIAGTSSGSGKVYVSVGDAFFESVVIDGQWSLSLGNIPEGAIAKVSVAVNGLLPSVPATAIAVKSSVATPVNSGDANGDGKVDASDIVSIVNYLLGKPSDSFNETNADANNDGQILVDDAVETINIITNQQ